MPAISWGGEDIGQELPYDVEGGGGGERNSRVARDISRPFQLSGPQVLEKALAPITPTVLEKANESRPSLWRAVNVLTRAWRVRGQKPDAATQSSGYPRPAPGSRRK